jgi:hypothetical protein
MRSIAMFWQKPCPSKIELALPTCVIDALVARGYMDMTEPSSNYKIADALRMAIEDADRDCRGHSRGRPQASAGGQFVGEWAAAHRDGELGQQLRILGFSRIVGAFNRRVLQCSTVLVVISPATGGGSYRSQCRFG